MERRTIVSGIVVAGLLFVGAASPRLQQAVGEMKGNLRTGWSNRTISSMADVWAPDGKLIDPSGFQAEGRGSVSQLLEQQLGRSSVGSDLKLDVKGIRELKGGTTEVDVAYEFTSITRATRNADRSGTYTATVVERGGKWQVISARPKTVEAKTPMKGYSR